MYQLQTFQDMALSNVLLQATFVVGITEKLEPVCQCTDIHVDQVEFAITGLADAIVVFQSFWINLRVI